MSRTSVSHRRKQPEVTVMFEPNRMASALLESAYLRVAPVLRRPLGYGPPAPVAPAPQTAEERGDPRERSAP